MDAIVAYFQLLLPVLVGHAGNWAARVYIYERFTALRGG